MRWLEHLDPNILVLLIPVVAIIMGGFYAITKVITNHQERLAMIARGIHPDSVKDK